MNYRDFKAAVALDANEPRDYEQIVFRTPDGIIYNNITVDFGYWNNSKDKAIIVNLFNIKPKFKVGDIVCNNSGLYPNVKYTIAEVNEELEYYGYKEINGRTYFKDQDKLMLIEEIKAKFKSGDIVINSMELNPKTELIIDTVNFEKEYYTFKNSPIQIKFKDQDKLILVKDGEVLPPVGDDIKLSLDVTIARQNVQIYNHNTYEQFSLIDKFIDKRSKAGYNSYTATILTTVLHRDKNDKILVYSDLIDKIVNHYTNLGFTVNVNKNYDNYKVLIEW